MTTPSLVFERTLQTREEKISFLEAHSDKSVIMDLTAFDKREFFERFPQLVAATSLHLNLTKKCEVTIRSKNEEVMAFLKDLGLEGVEVKSLTGFFHLPRILSTIINEAYFSLEDQIASADDIDRAMKFGVNYPEGPFAWSKGKESYVVTLLDNLFAATSNDRYKASALLRERSLI